MTTDDYEILPKQEISNLKSEIDTLKDSVGKGQTSQTLVSSMKNMTTSVNALLQIFQEAAQEMKLDEHDSVLLENKIDPLIDKIDKVLDQNEKIAKGIVAIADMTEEILSKMRGGYFQARKSTQHVEQPVAYSPKPTSIPSPLQGPQPVQTAPPQIQPVSSHVKPLPRLNTPPPTDQKKKPFFKLKFK